MEAPGWDTFAPPKSQATQSNGETFIDAVTAEDWGDCAMSLLRMSLILCITAGSSVPAAREMIGSLSLLAVFLN